MAILRIDIERALDELVSQENGMRFQGLAVALGKKRWPELIARQRKKDFGLDAYAAASLTAEKIGKGLAASVTPTLKKVSEDAKEAKDEFADLQALLFVTSAKVGNADRKRWEQAIRKDYGLELHVIEREEIISTLLMPENAQLCASHLYLDIAVEPGVADLIDEAAPHHALLADAVARRAAEIRFSLTPSILPRVERGVTHEKYLPAIRRGVQGGKSRIIPLVGPAGYGKTTVLGEIHDALTRSRETGLAIVRCNDLPLSVETAAELALAMGRLASDHSVPIADVVRAVIARLGSCVLMVDTLDLILTPRMVPEVAGVLRDVTLAGATVVLTCRDYEYRNLLEPPSDRWPALASAVDRYTVPEFSRSEAERAASAFVEESGHVVAERGAEFASAVLDLTADGEPLQQIVLNPLLLALLCELFAAEGRVPRDLTVSRLYETYWKRKVARGRSGEPHSEIAMSKVRLCLGLALHAFENSRSHLTDYIYVDELIPHDDVARDAFKELVSDGVLVSERATDRIRFFHQTFLEYSIARALLSGTGRDAKAQLLERLGEPHADIRQLHWWPVLRQLLTIAEQREAEAIFDSLDLESLTTFRTVALAAASRYDSVLLRPTVDAALRGRPEFRALILEAIAAPPQPLAHAAWDAAIALLRHGEHASAINAARLVGRMLGRSPNAAGERLCEAFDAIDARSGSDGGERTTLTGWLLQTALPSLERGCDALALSALRDRWAVLGTATRAGVLKLYRAPFADLSNRRQFVELLMSAPAPDHVKNELSDVVHIVASHSVACGEEGMWSSWETFLRVQLPKGWESVQARVVGRAAYKSADLCRTLVDGLLHEDTRFMSRYRLALQEAIEHGARADVTNAFLAHSIQDIAESRYAPIRTLVGATAQGLDSTAAEMLFRWIEPAAAAAVGPWVTAIAALASSAPGARARLDSLIQDVVRTGRPSELIDYVPPLPSEPRSRLITWLEGHANPNDKRLLLALIACYEQEQQLTKAAVSRLIAFAVSDLETVALAAASVVTRAICVHPVEDSLSSLRELLPLARSRFIGVRRHVVEGVSALVLKGHAVESTEMVAICHALAGEANPTVLQSLCRLVALWVQRSERVPGDVADVVGNLLSRLSDPRARDGGVPRALLVALKVIAQVEDIALTDRLAIWTRDLLRLVDMQQVIDGEGEAIDLVSAVARVQPAFLETLLLDAPGLPPRNVRAIVGAIRRVQGSRSPLLEQLLSSARCPDDVKSMILDMRGA